MWFNYPSLTTKHCLVTTPVECLYVWLLDQLLSLNYFAPLSQPLRNQGDAIDLGGLWHGIVTPAVVGRVDKHLISLSRCVFLLCYNGLCFVVAMFFTNFIPFKPFATGTGRDESAFGSRVSITRIFVVYRCSFSNSLYSLFLGTGSETSARHWMTK